MSDGLQVSALVSVQTFHSSIIFGGQFFLVYDRQVLIFPQKSEAGDLKSPTDGQSEAV